MKKMSSVFVAALGLACAVSASERSAENVIIDKIMPISGNRAVESNTRNVIRVYIQPVNWQYCRTTAFDLRKEDAHLYAALLTAASSGQRLSVTVDDVLKPIDDVCQVVLLGVSP